MPQKRNRRVGVEDPWTKTVRDADDNPQTVLRANYGKGMRWRARYVDDQGREICKRFARKADAQKWLDGVTSALVTGSYVAPEAGRMTVADVYASWSASQGHISRKDGGDPAQHLGQPGRAALGRRGGDRRQDGSGAGVDIEDGRG